MGVPEDRTTDQAAQEADQCIGLISATDGRRILCAKEGSGPQKGGVLLRKIFNSRGHGEI
jgi:hypothetical protein